MPREIHGLAAEFLGWTEEHAAGFSLMSLRDVVRMAPAGKLRDEVMAQIQAALRSVRVVVDRCPHHPKCATATACEAKHQACLAEAAECYVHVYAAACGSK